MKLFVTGATGVIGRRIVPMLVKDGHQVTAAVRSAGRACQLALAGAQPTVVNLFDSHALDQAAAGHEVVINLATHMPPSSMRMLLPGAWRENDLVRRVASANLVAAAIAGGAARFIQESFAPAYPDRGEAWIDEDTPIAPVRYNRTIADAERSAQRFTESGRIGVILRFAVFYGPDAFHVRDMIRFVSKGWAPMPGAANAYISSVSHDDAATAVLAALRAPAGIYNVADDQPPIRREYFDSLAEALGVPPPRLPPAWMAWSFGSMGELLARSQRISNRKFKSATGWAPKYRSVRDGWRALVDALGESTQAIAH
jgi:nucleoside-diphosphate-sugar epimerase